MTVNVDEVNLDGIVTRDEMLAMGCTEVTSRQGRKGYVIGEEVIAVECTKCCEVKGREGFSNSRGRFLGVYANCKECRRKYQEENRERLAKSDRKYYQENRGQVLGNVRKYREENRDRIARYKRKHYQENRERVAESGHRYREENREQIAERDRRYREENPSRILVIQQRRRARKLALPDDLTAEQLTEINGSFHDTCSLSGEPSDLHADHVLPISVGHGGTTRGNMIPLSATLNTSKGAMHIFEWFDANHERFGLSRDKFDALIEYLAEVNEMTTHEYRKYVDWCFDNPRVIDEATGELVFERDLTNERKAIV